VNRGLIYRLWFGGKLECFFLPPQKSEDVQNRAHDEGSGSAFDQSAGGGRVSEVEHRFERPEWTHTPCRTIIELEAGTKEKPALGRRKGQCRKVEFHLRVRCRVIPAARRRSMIA